MGKIKSFLEVRAVRSFDDLRRFASAQFSAIIEVVNGNLSFSDNIKGQIIECQFSQTGVEIPFRHSLAYVPTSYIVLNLNNNALIRFGTRKATLSEVFFVSSLAVDSVKIFVF